MVCGPIKYTDSEEIHLLGQGYLHSRPGLVNSISQSPRWILVHFKGIKGNITALGLSS